MTAVAAELEHMELQYGSSDTVNNRWDDDWDNENSSARLFERSRIKALAGRRLRPRPTSISHQTDDRKRSKHHENNRK